MSERAPIRGGRNAHTRGGASNASKVSSASAGQAEKPKKENILDLSKYVDKAIRVKFNGGREVEGILKGFDPLMNLVLDEVKEVLRGMWYSSLVVRRGLLRVLFPTSTVMLRTFRCI